MKTQSLTYVRGSRNPAQPGFEYFHHFGTGHQELIFTTHEKAAAFADRNGCQYTGPSPAQLLGASGGKARALPLDGQIEI
jgi:hypothetical protein